jgi:DNA-binding NtrC family response regulator
MLAHRFLSEACTRTGALQLAIASEAMDALLRHPFPGNLSELRDTMQRASALSKGPSITRTHLVFDNETKAPRRRKR